VKIKGKRILYLCGELSLIGGIEKYNTDFIAAINLTGARVKVVERKTGGIASKVSFIIRALFSMLTFLPNHIICAHLHFSPIAFAAFKFFKVNFSLALYGIEAITINNSIYRLAVNNAKKIIVISEYTKYLVNSQFKLSDDKFFMLISSVDSKSNMFLENPLDLKKKYGFKDDLIILTISRQSSIEEKGQHRVIKAYLEVLKKFPNSKYIMAGPGSDIRVKEILNDNPTIQNNVLNLGLINDTEKNELYNLCDVFVLPSKNEGFGIVFIEALVCGAKVIASNGFGCFDGLLNGRLGVVVNPDDSKELEDAISNTLQNAPMWTIEDRRRIREQTLEVYGYESWCEKVENFIVQIGKH